MNPYSYQKRNFAIKAGPIYNAVLRTNARYVAFIVVGAAITEGIYGGFTDRAWKFINRGKVLYF